MTNTQKLIAGAVGVFLLARYLQSKTKNQGIAVGEKSPTSLQTKIIK